MPRDIVTTTLDSGKCPPWLYQRMVQLSSIILELMVEIHGPSTTLKIISHPVWFQSFGTFLGFDWNASGLTTVLTAAIKEVLSRKGKHLGICMAGGKGKTSLKTPEEIMRLQDETGWGTPYSLVDISRLTAKIDNSLIQDGFTIYHHVILFTKEGEWAVIQQGMNTHYVLARRYHWHNVPIEKFLYDPHFAIMSDRTLPSVLNLSASESESNRNSIISLLCEPVHLVKREIARLLTSSKNLLFKDFGDSSHIILSHKDFHHHPVELEDHFANPYFQKMLERICGRKYSFMELILEEGVGPKTIRALSLMAEIIYGAVPSYRDPARYSFAHGGKDAVPYPIDKETYDATIEFLITKLEKKNLIRRR